MKLIFKYLILFIITPGAYALTYPLDNSTEVFGKVFTVTPQTNDTFSDYARMYNVGAVALQRANPGIDENYPDKQLDDITIPAEFVLPSKRDGIVINLPELRVYYFMPSQVATYPVSIGRVGWETPVRETSVIGKEKNPSWNIPKSIQAENRAKGINLPAVVPPGPNNPLGKYAIRLGISGYLLHGTNAPASIGRRVSHGCIRLFPDDIEELYPSVPIGTPVSLINEPIKAGWRDNKLYLQVYPLLQEYPMSETTRQELAKNVINNAKSNKSIKIDWDLVDKAMREKSGIPEMIGNNRLL
ncbi:MAG: L,D-transpeptidase family protein [Legionellales bacterium]|jgi:L,D-transpeptidase ErfK/SrfK